MDFPEKRLLQLLEPLASCTICPRNCKANRFQGNAGVCGSDAAFNISSIAVHHGEEPAIGGRNGICNVFFSRCNLACSYCQNYQISRNRGKVNENHLLLQEVIDSIIPLLNAGCHAVGFVSPSHYVPQVKAIIEALRSREYNPVFVFNTNGYDRAEEIAGLESYIDIYLPDYKYSDNSLSRKYSKVADYQQVAIASIKEMYCQKGSALIINEQGIAEQGIIVRHLVLPGNTENSLNVLRNLAEISTSLAVSLMAQYFPVPAVYQHPELGRYVTEQEYETVKNELETLGFYKGWVQELESREYYRPDFSKDEPFG